MKPIFLALSFFTSIKMPQVEFNKQNYKYLPLLLVVVGIIIGIITTLLIKLLGFFDFSPLLKATIVVAYFAFITGGIHLDGLLDTADSYFSRRDLKRRLEIMHDSNIGAFACILAILFFMLKVAVIREMFIYELLNYSIVFVPILSRTFAALMICSAKYATSNGLASMYEEVMEKWYKYVIVVQIICVSIVFLFFDFSIVYATISIVIYFVLYLNFMYKNYNGITGDILGAFIETSELVMLFAILGFALW